jgi:hypothetical protein
MVVQNERFSFFVTLLSLTVLKPKVESLEGKLIDIPHKVIV